MRKGEYKVYFQNYVFFYYGNQKGLFKQHSRLKAIKENTDRLDSIKRLKG